MADAEQHGVRDGHRQRQVQRESRAFANLGCDVHSPPSASTFFFTTSIPTPRPETSVTFSAVEKPGRKIKVEHLAVGQFRAMSDQAWLNGLGDDLLAVQALAIVGKLYHDVAGRVERPQRDRAGWRLARGRSLFRTVDATVNGVANHVNQRVV